MQLRHVEYFVATVEEGTASRAAARLHVTQPALSRQLRTLEHDLGVTLFDRGAGRMTLNRAGAALLPVARELLASAHQLRAAAELYRHGRIDRLTIAAPTVTLTDVVSPFVATMTPDDPVVDVRYGDGESIETMLTGGADLAIGTRRPPRPLCSRPLAVLPLWAYVAPDDPWAGRDHITLSELLTRQIIALPSTYTAREALDAAVAAQGSEYSTLMTAANGTIAQALAATGRGVAVVSDDPRYDLAPLTIRAGNRPLSIRLFAAWDPRSVAAPTVETIASRLSDWITRRYGGTG